MLRKTTNSERILLLFLLLLVLGVIQFAYAISTHIVEQPESCITSPEIGKGEMYFDTLSQAYDHVYVSFSEVQLHPRIEDKVYIHGYQNVRDLMDMYVRNDTLFITPMTECSPKPVESVGHGAIEVRVGAIGVKSITLAKSAQLRTPIKAIGADQQGVLKYKEEDLEKYQIEFDTLTLNLEDRASFNLFVKGTKLTINADNNYGVLSSIAGACDVLELKDINGRVGLNTSNMINKKTVINGAKNRDRLMTGSISVHPTELLEAYLYDDLDVLFEGSPKIIKEETSSGRVINVNGFK